MFLQIRGAPRGTRFESSSVEKNLDISKNGLPERLKRTREEKNISVAELAEKAGLSEKTVRNIETRQQLRVQAATIHRLAKALGVSYPYLLYGSSWRRYQRHLAVSALVVVALVAAAFWHPTSSKNKTPPEDPPQVTTTSREAYQHYVLGDETLKRLNREEAKAHFRAALDIDTTFAMACVALTDPAIRGTREEARALIDQSKRHAGKVTDIEKHFIESRDRYLTGDVDGAIAELQQLVVEHPGNKNAWALADAYRIMGAYYSGKRELDDAISSFEKALAIDPRDATSWNSLAYAKETAGDVDGALRACDEYIKACPHEQNPYDTRGDLLARHGRPDEAILAFKEALKLRPDFYPSMQYLGVIYLLKRDYPDAGTCFHDLTLAKDVGARGRGRLYTAAIPLYQGKLNEALAELNRGLAEDRLENHNGPDYQHKMLLKASILAERGEYDDAIGESRLMLESTRESDPRALPEWLDDHVRLLVRAKRFDEARAALDSSAVQVREGPGNDNCYYWMAKGWLDFGLENYPAACSDFERAYDVEPMFYNGYPLGLAYISAGRPADAVKLFETLVMRYKDERAAYPIEAVKMYYYMGVAYQETGRGQDAARMYREFLDTWKGADRAFDGIKTDARRRLAHVVS